MKSENKRDAQYIFSIYRCTYVPLGIPFHNALASAFFCPARGETKNIELTV